MSALFLDDYLRRIDLDGAEVYALMLMSASGGVIMASANELIVLFLGFESLSLALYVMAAFFPVAACSAHGLCKAPPGAPGVGASR